MFNRKITVGLFVLLLAHGLMVPQVSNAATSEDTIQQAYIAYYGRAGDPGGVDYWVGQLDSAGGDLNVIIDQFGTSSGFESRYGSLSNSQLIDNIYQQMFGRDPDSGGKAFYLDKLDNGELSLQSITLDILNGASGDDSLIIDNKTSVAKYFTAQVESSGFAYNSSSVDGVVSIFADIGSGSAAYDQAVNAIDAAIAADTVNLPLNDTGLTWGGNIPDGNNESCIGETIAEQDCSHGRDATHNDDSDGHAGFSFTKLDTSGNDLEASAGTWSCVKDNITGLIWEVKTVDGSIHDKSNIYRWGGKGADENGGGTYSDEWDVLVDGSNSENLCGGNDWRVPSVYELTSIVSFDRFGPAIDTDYFPNAISTRQWSTSVYSNTTVHAWAVDFTYGASTGLSRSSAAYNVRLVRGVQ
jgi:hypothetical protein